jgi:hypothetical protein
MHSLLLFMTCDPRPFNYIYLNVGSVHSISPSKNHKDKAVVVYGCGSSVVMDSTPEEVADRLGMIYEPHPEM